jgi:hypothetical protein
MEARPYEGLDETGRAAARCRRVALAWTRGEATREDVIAAHDDAVYASCYVGDTANVTAAAHAAHVAYVATGIAAAHASYYAAADAADFADAADGAYDVDVRYRVLARCADIVRMHYPDPPELMPSSREGATMDRTMAWATGDGVTLESSRDHLRDVARRVLGTDDVTLYSVALDERGCIVEWSWWRGGPGGAEATCDESDVPEAARTALLEVAGG